jgi:hypothetical protein
MSEVPLYPSPAHPTTSDRARDRALLVLVLIEVLGLVLIEVTTKRREIADLGQQPVPERTARPSGMEPSAQL